MKKSIFIHGAWALLAAGAWFAGAHHQSNSASPQNSRSAIGGALSSTSPAREKSGAAKGILKNDAAGESVRWLDAYRGSNGVITAGKMKEAALAAMREPDPVKSLLNFAMLMNELTPENAPAALEAAMGSAGGPDSYRFLSL